MEDVTVRDQNLNCSAAAKKYYFKNNDLYFFKEKAQVFRDILGVVWCFIKYFVEYFGTRAVVVSILVMEDSRLLSVVLSMYVAIFRNAHSLTKIAATACRRRGLPRSWFVRCPFVSPLINGESEPSKFQQCATCGLSQNPRRVFSDISSFIVWMALNCIKSMPKERILPPINLLNRFTSTDIDWILYSRHYRYASSVVVSKNMLILLILIEQAVLWIIEKRVRVEAAHILQDPRNTFRCNFGLSILDVI